MSYSSKTLIQTNSEPATYEKRLSICLTPNGFSFSELGTTGRLLTFGEAEGGHAAAMTQVMADVKAYFASVGIQPLGYKSIELVAPSEENVWVPNELYAAGHNRQYLSLVGGSSTTVLTADCKAIASTAVFSANDTLATAFKVAMPGLVVKNQHVKLAESSLRDASKTHPMLVVHWRGQRLDLAAFREGKYIYGNTLGFKSEAEALFHTIEVLKTFGLEGSAVELLMCGEATRERFTAFRPYFPKATLFTGTADTSALRFKTLRTYQHALILI